MFEAAEQIRVLIVEKDRVFRRNISERLQLAGVEISGAGDEAEAKDILLNSDIDVVLLGAKGARRSGLELLKLVKENRPLTEVLLMTPLDDHSLFISIEAMKLGAFDDLLIPFDIETLLGKVRAAGRQKRKNEQEKQRKE